MAEAVNSMPLIAFLVRCSEAAEEVLRILTAFVARYLGAAEARKELVGQETAGVGVPEVCH